MARRRTAGELVAAAGKYLQTVHRGNRAVYEHAHTVTRNLSRPLDQLRQEQLVAVRRIVDHAFKFSPFYRERFKAAGYEPGGIRELADLTGLPRLSKTDLVDNMDRILCGPRAEMVCGSTSGTTGVTLTYYRSRAAHCYRRGIDLAVARFYGWRDGQWQGWLWGADPDVLATDRWKNRFLMNWVERRYFMDLAHISDTTYQGFVDDTKHLRPTFVSAYPTLAFDLAERIEAGRVTPVRVPVLSTTAEPLLDHQRAKIKAFLADEVYDRYGAREYGIIAMECREHRGMHTFMDSVYLETVPASAAEHSQRVLLVTDLWNYGMPLIRYDSGDYADLDFSDCPCGIATPRVHNIRGRVTDTIWRPNGVGYDGLHVSDLILQANIPVVLQFVQETPNRVTIRLEAQPGQFAGQLERLLQLCREHIGTDMIYDVQAVDKIERTPSGKFRNVICNIPRPTVN